MYTATSPILLLNATQNSLLKYKKELLIGLSLALISQSRLRFAGMPIGLGEILLALLMLYGVFLKPFFNRFNKREGRWDGDALNGISSNWAKKYITYFGFIFLLAVTMASIGSLPVYQAVQYHYLKHNIMAYAYAGLVFYYFLKSDINFSATALSFSVIILFILCCEVFFLSPDVVFYYGARLIGLSNNPNQLAVNVLMLPLFIIHCRKFKTISGFNFQILFALTLLSGYLVHSSAYFVAYLVMLLVFVFHLLNKWQKSKSMIFFTTIVLLVLIAGIHYKEYLLTCADIFWNNIDFNVNDFSKMAQNLVVEDAVQTTTVDRVLLIPAFSFGNEGNVRMVLWGQAIGLLLENPLLGLGAGAGVYQESTYLFSEAHNSFLDVAIQSGLLGIGLYAVFLGLILIQIIKKKDNVVLLMYVVLLVFSCFHFTFRQPIIWFYFAYMLKYDELKP